MPRKRIKDKKKINYRIMNLYDDLHCALTGGFFDDIVNIDWNDKELVKNLWEWHGEKIMNEWKNDPTHAGKRPKIFWYIFAKKEDFKILRYEDYVTNAVGYYCGEPCTPNEKPIIRKDPVFESETAYLDRKGLLEPWELEYFKNHNKRLEDVCTPFWND